MSPTTEPTAAPSAPTKELRERRGFWRILLAIIAPMPFLAKGVFDLLSPVEGDAGFADSVTAYEANSQLIEVLPWIDAVFVVTLIPATFAVAWVARRGAPRLATAGGVLSLTGFFTGLTLLGGVMTPALVTVRQDLDATAMAALDDALHHEPLLGIASLLFIVGIVFGLGLLGGALWRSGYAPAWMGIALIIGGATHPFIPTNVGQGIGLLVGAVGFAGASVALLRMTNAEFDLPARART
ncbi:MAG: hypothetical protein ACRDOT_05700 [Aeromicrobium sp.]